jgi:hypothetical protein
MIFDVRTGRKDQIRSQERKITSDSKWFCQDCRRCLHQTCCVEFFLGFCWRIESRKADDNAQKAHHRLVNEPDHFVATERLKFNRHQFMSILIFSFLSTKSSVMTKLGKMPSVTCDLKCPQYLRWNVKWPFWAKSQIVIALLKLADRTSHLWISLLKCADRISQTCRSHFSNLQIAFLKFADRISQTCRSHFSNLQISFLKFADRISLLCR